MCWASLAIAISVVYVYFLFGTAIVDLLFDRLHVVISRFKFVKRILTVEIKYF
jgi:hypothetical protein